jgi:hypothetical protein
VLPARLPVDADALTVAMAVAPGVYARNRMFTLFTDPEVRRAKARGGILRGVVRQLSGAQGQVDRVTFSRGPGVSPDGKVRCILRYRIARMKLERFVEMTELEAACVVYLASRAGLSGMHATEGDRALLDGALKRLANGLELAALEAR